MRELIGNNFSFFEQPVSEVLQFFCTEIATAKLFLFTSCDHSAFLAKQQLCNFDCHLRTPIMRTESLWQWMCLKNEGSQVHFHSIWSTSYNLKGYWQNSIQENL